MQSPLLIYHSTDKPMERKFTFVQMKQIKHMYYEDPVTWNYDNLAAQFDTDHEVSKICNFFLIKS